MTSTKRKGKRFAWFVIAGLLTLLLLGCVLVLANLASVLNATLPSMAQRWGVDIQKIHIQEFTLDHIKIEHLSLSTQHPEKHPEYGELHLINGVIQYRWQDVINGKLEQLLLNEVSITANYLVEQDHEYQEESEGKAYTPKIWLQESPQEWLAKLPIKHIELKKTALHLRPIAVSESIPETSPSATTQALDELIGEASILLLENELNIKLNLSAPIETKGQLSISKDNEVVLHLSDSANNTLQSDIRFVNEPSDQATSQAVTLKGHSELLLLNLAPWKTLIPSLDMQQHFSQEAIALKLDWQTLFELSVEESESDADLLPSKSDFSLKAKVINAEYDESFEQLNMDVHLEGHFEEQMLQVKTTLAEMKTRLSSTMISEDPEFVKTLSRRQRSKDWFDLDITMDTQTPWLTEWQFEEPHWLPKITQQEHTTFHAGFKNTSLPSDLMLTLRNMVSYWEDEDFLTTANLEKELNTGTQNYADLPTKSLAIKGKSSLSLKNDIWRLTLPKGKLLTLHQWQEPDLTIQRIHVGLKAPMTLSGQGDIWSATPIHAAVKLSPIQMPDMEIFTSTLLIKGLLSEVPQKNAKDKALKFKGQYELPKLSIQGDGYRISDLKLKGSTTLLDPQFFTAESNITGADNQLKLKATFNQNYKTGLTRIDFELPSTALDSFPQEKLFSPTMEDLSLTAGTLELKGFLQWDEKQDIHGQGDLVLDNLSALYQDYAFQEINTALTYHWTPEQDILLYSQRPISIQTINVGVPLTETSFDVGLTTNLDGSDLKIGFANVRSQLFSGIIHSDDLSFDTKKDENPFILNITHIDMSKAAELYPESGITVEGILDGSLPASLNSKGGLTIPQSQLVARAPGGIVKYKSAATDAVSQTNQGTDIAFRALQNFHFKTLSADVKYQPDGWLNLDFHFQGNNPDVMEGTPINLNTNFELNVLDLLYSLRSQQTGNKLGERLRQKLSQ